MPFIKTEQLTYDYIRRDDTDMVAERVNALTGISLEIEEGEFVAIVGRNGSGKSTFARLINALEVPTEGRLFVDGMDTSEEQNIWEIRRRVGMVFQNPDNQIIGTVVEEDVGFGPENLGVPTQQIWERVERALHDVDMSEYAKESPNKLSGGQKQRISIAGALAMQPKCIVLDEPTAMLDPQGRREVMDVISRLNKYEGMTVILITHYMEEAAQAGRIIVMDKGSVAMDGTPEQVFAHKEELISLGLDLPAAMQLAEILKANGVRLPATILNEDELVEALCR